MRHTPLRWLGLALLARAAAAQVEYYTLSTLPTTDFGRAVAAVGDLDADGVDDLGVGESMGPVPFGPGAVHLYSGDSGAPLLVVVGGGTGSLFGAALAAAGDIDDDGFPDVVIGAYADAHEGTAAGRAFVHSGRSGALLLTLDDSGAEEWLGLSVAGCGDVDLDGVPDLAVGAPGHVFGVPKPGRVAIYSGADAALLRDVPGLLPGDDFGWTLAAPGDLGGDGVPDLAVGAPGEVPGPGAGRVAIVNGASGAIAKVLQPPVPSPGFGLGLAAFDDVDGDGVNELAVGAPLYTATGFHSGAVFLYSGHSGALHAVLRGAPLESFGQTLARVPDVTGDGVDELLVGAPSWPITQQYPNGRVAVVDVITGHRLAQVDGPAGAAFGHALTCLGDTNDDGLPELAVAGDKDVVVLGAP